MPKHTRTEKGTYRRERGDALLKNLKKEYPTLEPFNGNMKLATLRDKFGANSLDEVLKAIKQGKEPQQ